MRTAKDLMTTSVPRAAKDASAASLLSALRAERPREASHIYLVDDDSRLTGQVPIENLLAASVEEKAWDLRGDPPLEFHPQDSAETVALLAVERHEADVAVIDEDRRLLGAIPIGQLLALLHEEHIDNALRMAGVGAAHPSPTEEHSSIKALRGRLPWLIIGLAGGILAGGVASLFEESLKRNVSVAFFLPMVVYLADAIGTQTETVLVRRLAYGRVRLTGQLLREGSLGLAIGLTLGVVAWATIMILNVGAVIALVVALTVFASAMVATQTASLLPWFLDRLGADPALASGPLATVVQDLLSVAIYLAIATALL
ncbi:MAG: magnesium transporter [Acidobacteriota bacterium]